MPARVDPNCGRCKDFEAKQKRGKLDSNRVPHNPGSKNTEETKQNKVTF